MDPAMAAIMKMFQPLMDFHAASEDRAQHDVRFYWDVRAVSGDDENLVHVSGVSTMTNLLHPNNLHQALERVSLEMVEKVAKPVAEKFQALANDAALASIPDEAEASLPPPAPRGAVFNAPVHEAELVAAGPTDEELAADADAIAREEEQDETSQD